MRAFPPSGLKAFRGAAEPEACWRGCPGFGFHQLPTRIFIAESRPQEAGTVSSAANVAAKALNDSLLSMV
jgi:hypothetical protein